MSSPGSQSAETVAKRPFQLPTIGGKYFALAVLFAMNLLNYVDRYSFFAAGTHIQKDLHIDDDWFGVLGVVVHDRVHDRLAADGLAGRSL